MSTRMVGAAMRHGWRIGLLVVAVALVAVMAGRPKASNSIVVVAVPWQGSEARFHSVTDGGTVILQAVASSNGDGGQVPLTSGTWDPGDGTGPIGINVSNSRILELTHTYTAPVGTPFTATIRVTDADGDVHTDTFKVRVEPNTLDTQANMAIDKGLWYSHKSMIVTTQATVITPAVPNFIHPAFTGNTVVDQVSPNLSVWRDNGGGLRTPDPNNRVITSVTPAPVGGPVAFDKSVNGYWDQITPDLALYRNYYGPLYVSSSHMTRWSWGACGASNVYYNSSIDAMRATFPYPQYGYWGGQGGFPTLIPGQTMCLLDLTAGLGYDLTFSSWTNYYAGANFAYTRVQSAVVTSTGGDTVQWAAGTCDAPITPFYSSHDQVLQSYFRFQSVTGNRRNRDSVPNVPQCLRNVTTGVDYDFTISHWGSGTNTGSGGDNGEFAYIREGLPGGSPAVFGPPTYVGYWNGQDAVASTSAAIQAFEVNGHRETGSPLANPYVNDVAAGLKYLQAHIQRVTVDAQGHAGTPADPSPDTNGNLYGLQSDQGDLVYVGGQIIDAFVASGTPSAVATMGTEAGRTYMDIVQDLMDAYAYGMDETNGGWIYNWNEWGIDSSSAGWWGVGKHAADVWGVTTPQWVKDRNRSAGIPILQGADGSCGYRSTHHEWSPVAETAACMIMLAADGVARTDTQFAAAENFVAGAFGTAHSNNPGGIEPNDSIYAMYNLAKAMRTAVDSSGNAAPIAMLGGTVDWYGGPNGLARNLIDNQQGDGRLAPQQGPYIDQNLANSWGILILSPALFEQGPTAACSVDSSIVCQAGAPGGCNTTGTDPYATVNFDGSASSAGDNPIASYAWNFQNGGSTTDATTVTASTSFSSLGTFNVQLTVTDTAGHSSSVTCPVQVVDSALPPVSDPGGPYEICEGRGSVVLNGSGSLGRGANIVSHEWDFTGAITFTPVDATGVSTNQTAYFTSLPPGTYDVGLRVTDDSLSHFTTTNYTTVTVKPDTAPECADVPPTADNQHVVTPEDTPIGITLTGVDPDGNAVTYTVTGGPSHGTLSGTGANLTYTPAADYTGPDSFTFTVNDGTYDSAPATVTIEVTPVNDPPVANPDAKVTPEDTAVGGQLTSSDVDGGAPAYSLATGPSHGGVVVNADGSYLYTPAANYNGPDSFTYTVSDGAGGTATATVTIDVTPVNDAPDCSAVVVSPATIWPPNHKWVTLVASGGTDADGDALTYTATAIFQDEPTNSYGDGNTATDGAISGTGGAAVRAERSGKKDGRVYHVFYTVSDGHGGSCQVEETACVPHDQGRVDDDKSRDGKSRDHSSADDKSGKGRKKPKLVSCTDGGALYNSLVATPKAKPDHDPKGCKDVGHAHGKDDQDAWEKENPKKDDKGKKK